MSSSRVRPAMNRCGLLTASLTVGLSDSAASIRCTKTVGRISLGPCEFDLGARIKGWSAAQRGWYAQLTCVFQSA